MTSDDLVAVLTWQDELADLVLAMSTTAGLTAELMADVDALLDAWGRAALVVIGADQAAAVADVSPPRRRDVLVIGRDDDPATLMRWSGPLGAVVVPVPDGLGGLRAALARAASGGSGRGRLVAVVGGSGGVGASTAATAIALAAERRSLRCALIDLDPLGGGLDLLLGVEHHPGWRWPDLAGVGGHVPDLGSELVSLDGLSLLSMERGRHQTPTASQIETVLDAAARDFDLVVVDVARAGLPGAHDVVRRSELVVLVARADVRAFAAAQHVLASFPPLPRLGLVLRGPGLDADAYADRLGAELHGVVGDERQVQRDVDHGVAPGRQRRSRLGRAAAAVVDRVVRDPGSRRVAAA